MNKVWMVVALVSSAYGYAAVSDAEAAAPIAMPRCEIRETTIRGGLRIDAVIRGTPGEAGSYRFLLDRTGSGGDSAIGQGGAFTISQLGENIVARNELSISANDSFRAHMRVISGKAMLDCERAG